MKLFFSIVVFVVFTVLRVGNGQIIACIDLKTSIHSAVRSCPMIVEDWVT